MARVLRGDVLWADLDPTRGREQAGQRPVLVISHDIFNERSGTVIAMAITSQPQKAGFPLTVELTKGDLPKRSLLFLVNAWGRGSAGSPRRNFFASSKA
jgi:mRNA interferase MazF